MIVKNDKPADKILERIRNLLAMGSDLSSEHEAAIALRRARKLMDEHQVSLTDIENIKDEDFGSAFFESDSKRAKIWINGLAISVADLNDCVVTSIRTYSGNFKGYQYDGYAEDVSVCEFMLVYLVDTCNRFYLRDKEKLGLRGLAEKNDYITGLSNGIRIRIAKMIEDRKKTVISDGRSLVLFKKAAVEEKFGEGAYKEVDTRDAVSLKAYLAGAESADDVHLGSFVGNEVEENKAIAY